MRPPPLSWAVPERGFWKTVDSPYDLFIIGGGINGCGIARDAAGRGLRTGLAEMGDLAQGTSSASTKLIHGGLRYLERYEFRLVREALQEREVLLAIAPHLVRPRRFVLPLAAGMRPRWLLRLGLFLYDHIAGRTSLPGSKAVKLRAGPHALSLQGQFTRGFEYSDCQVDDSRLVILNARDAAARGADILPRMRVTAARRDGPVWRIELHSANGQIRRAHARMLVNAAGPWANSVSAIIEGAEQTPAVRLVQGAHIVVPRLFDHDRAYIFQNRDGRIVFAIPYEQDFTLIGTTDREFSGDPATSHISAEETAYLIEAANSYFSRQIAADNIVWAFAGVRALADASADKAQSASRDYRLELDAPPGRSPLLSVLGGKITSYRTLAVHALAKLANALPEDGRLRLPEWTHRTPLPGGELSVAALRTLGSVLARQPGAPGGHILQRWLASYGSQAQQLCAAFAGPDGPGRHFGGGLYAAEVFWLMQNEWAMTADDVLWRRSKLGLRLTDTQAGELAEFLSAQSGASRSEP